MSQTRRVLLVPGYAALPSCWRYVETQLCTAGFDVATFGFASLIEDPRAAARAARRSCPLGGERIAALPRGHGLGGIVVRYAVHGVGLDDEVLAAVTVCTPHEGVALARFGVGPIRSLQPGSPLLREIDEATRPGSVRWIAFYSDRDLVVPASSAAPRHPPLRVRSLGVPAGHLRVLVSPQFVRALIRELRTVTARPVPRGIGGSSGAAHSGSKALAA
jgi:hypothetical protein